MALLVEGELGASGVVAALIVGDESLGSILLPLHRPRQLAARPNDERMLRINERLHAESAPDIRRY
jgi:hypothetical protein